MTKRVRRKTKREVEDEFLAFQRDSIKKVMAQYALYSDFHDRHLLNTNSSLSMNEKLEILKSLPEWPRIVLELYEAEFAAAKHRKKNNPVGEPGRARDIAYEKVGETVGLGDDRIHALCKEGRRQIRAGEPKISVEEFKKLLTK